MKPSKDELARMMNQAVTTGVNRVLSRYSLQKKKPAQILPPANEAKPANKKGREYSRPAYQVVQNGVVRVHWTSGYVTYIGSPIPGVPTTIIRDGDGMSKQE